MKIMNKNWQRTLATFATVAAIQTPNLIVAQGDPPPAIPIAGTAVNALLSAERPVPPAAPAGGNFFGRGGEPRFGGQAGALAGMMPPSHDGLLERKLREIVLDEVKFDGLPLSEVLNFLGEASQKHDPEKKGINFLIDPNPPQIGPSTAPATIDPATGLPLTASLMEQIDMGSVSVRFNMALRHVTMADVLDAIVRVADHPIQYSVEDYAVIFSLRPEANSMPPMAGRTAGPAPLAVRTFHVDTNTFVGGLESAFGIKVDGKGKSDSRKIQAALKDLLAQLNVSTEGNKAIFYNELTGTVMARVALEDVDVVRAAIVTLGGEETGNFAMGYGGMAPSIGVRR